MMIQNTPKIPNYASLSGHTCVLQIKLTRIRIYNTFTQNTLEV